MLKPGHGHTTKKRQNDDATDIANRRGGDEDTIPDETIPDTSNHRGDDNNTIPEEDEDERPNTVSVEDNSNEDTGEDDVAQDSSESRTAEDDSMEVDTVEQEQLQRHEDEADTQLITPTEESSEMEGGKDDTYPLHDMPLRPHKARRLSKKTDDKRHKASTYREPPPPSSRYPSRNNRSRNSRYVHAAAASGNMTIQAAKAKHPTTWREAMDKELKQMHDMMVIEPIDEPVVGLLHSRVIGVKGFFKAKNSAITGKFEKLKFRLVPQGHLVDRSLYRFDETTSPTVSLESVFACINLGAFENRRGFTMDIPGAYLNAELKHPHMVRFGADLTAEYTRLYPEYKKYIQENGTMLFIVKKAFYGLPESSALWYDEFAEFLNSLGYVSHPCDKGLFVYSDKRYPDRACVLCLWVDDILGWANDDNMIRNMEESVIEKYGGARLDAGNNLQFIGMVITQPTNGIIYTSQIEYTRKILHATGTSGNSDDPNHSNLLREKTERERRVKVDTTEYASHLMMAMYLAKRTRHDILTPLSILATRMQDPDVADKKALEKVYKYLNQTVDYGLTYKPTSMELHYWTDAAYALHRDKRGHTGIMVTLGYNNAPIYAKSAKQKLHTRSSTEAELVALDESILHLLWLRQLMDFIGYTQQPSYVYQDNKSTIMVCETGQSRNGKLKHMAVRYYFIHGQIEQNVVQIKYCESSDMTADILTKPLSGDLFKKLRNKILNKE